MTDSVLDSLDTSVDGQAELTWRNEIERRIKGLDSGQVRLTPWTEVRSRLLAARKNAR